MAKTKQQKQQEALERKRLLLPEYRQRVHETYLERSKAFAALTQIASHDPFRARYVQEVGLCEQNAREAIKRLHRLCLELNCDSSGNPL